MFNFRKILIVSALMILATVGFYVADNNNNGFTYTESLKEIFNTKEALAVAAGCTQGACSGYTDPPPYCSGYTDPPRYCSGYTDPPPYCSGYTDPPPYCSGYTDPPRYCSGYTDPPRYCSGGTGCLAYRYGRCVSRGCRAYTDPPRYCSSYTDPPRYCSSYTDPPRYCSSYTDPPRYCSSYTDPPRYCSSYTDPPRYCSSYGPDVCPAVNGSCGSSNNSCSVGTLADTTDTSTNYLWQCNGSNGGSNTSCSVAKADQCGTANDACTVGTYSNVSDTTTEYKWKCGSLSCSATKPDQCGTANNNCVVGSWSEVSDTTTEYKWKCGSLSCSVAKAINGSCGSSNNSCSSGSLQDTTDTSTNYLWQCNGSNGGSTMSCSLAIVQSSTADSESAGVTTTTSGNIKTKTYTGEANKSSSSFIGGSSFNYVSNSAKLKSYYWDGQLSSGFNTLKIQDVSFYTQTSRFFSEKRDGSINLEVEGAHEFSCTNESAKSKIWVTSRDGDTGSEGGNLQIKGSGTTNYKESISGAFGDKMYSEVGKELDVKFDDIYNAFYDSSGKLKTKSPQIVLYLQMIGKNHSGATTPYFIGFFGNAADRTNSSKTTFNQNEAFEKGDILRVIIPIGNLPDPSADLSGTSPIDYNCKPTLSWTVNDIDSCSATGSWSGSKSATDGTYSETMTSGITTATTYGLSCSAINNTYTDSVTVSVNAKPTVDLKIRKNGTSNSYTDGPLTLRSGERADLKWTTTNTSGYCTASGGWSGSNKNASGGTETSGSISTNKSFTITCKNSCGYSVTDTVNVGIDTEPPAISCSASPSSVGLNETVTFSSNVTGGKSPYTYTWTGEDNLSRRGSDSSITKSYSTEGTKNIIVDVADANSRTGSGSCSVTVIMDQCGATNDACTVGTYSNVSDTTTEYKWKCGSLSCSVAKADQCGATNNSCISGTRSDIADSSAQYKWKCGSLTCTEEKTSNACGDAAGGTYSSKPLSKLCENNDTPSVSSNDNKWSWTCLGSGGSQGGSCTAYEDTITLTIQGGGQGTLSARLANVDSDLSVTKAGSVGTVSGGTISCDTSSACKFNVNSTGAITVSGITAVSDNFEKWGTGNLECTGSGCGVCNSTVKDGGCSDFTLTGRGDANIIVTFGSGGCPDCDSSSSSSSSSDPVNPTSSSSSSVPVNPTSSSSSSVPVNPTSSSSSSVPGGDPPGGPEGPGGPVGPVSSSSSSGSGGSSSSGGSGSGYDFTIFSGEENLIASIVNDLAADSNEITISTSGDCPGIITLSALLPSSLSGSSAVFSSDTVVIGQESKLSIKSIPGTTIAGNHTITVKGEGTECSGSFDTTLNVERINTTWEEF